MREGHIKRDHLFYKLINRHQFHQPRTGKQRMDSEKNTVKCFGFFFSSNKQKYYIVTYSRRFSSSYKYSSWKNCHYTTITIPRALRNEKLSFPKMHVLLETKMQILQHSSEEQPVIHNSLQSLKYCLLSRRKWHICLPTDRLGDSNSCT